MYLYTLYHCIQVDIFSQDLILIPIHLGSHWATVIIDFVAKEIVYYDSKETMPTTVQPPCLHSIQ